MSESRVMMATDGACRGNPGPGGWGVWFRHPDGRTASLKGYESATTNNRMELSAVIEGLKTLKVGTFVEVVTDSTYVMKGMTEWLPRWVQRRWRTAAGQPVKNQDLWQICHALCKERDVTWRWVKGHAGHPDNERADRLANEAIDAQR